MRLRMDWLLLLLSLLLRLGLAGHVGERRGVRACCQREDEHEQREALLLHLEGFSRHEDGRRRRGARSRPRKEVAGTVTFITDTRRTTD